MTPARRVRRPVPWLALGVLAMALAVAGRARADTVAVIPVEHRFARDLEGPARAALTPGGTLVVDEGRNAFVVHDDAAGLAALRQVLAALDRAPATVTLEVRALTAADLERLAVDVSVGARSGDVAVGAGSRPPARDGVRVGLRLDAERLASTGRITSRARVTSGEEALLSSGSTVPLVVPGDRHHAGAVTYLDAADGFRARPTVLGDGRVRVELEPRTARLAGGGVVERSSASTVLVVEPGQAVVLGEVAREASSDRRGLLGQRHETGSERLTYVLTATVDPPPEGR